MKTYNCTDGNADIEIEADSPSEAAQEYVSGGDWGSDDHETFWIKVYVTDEEGYRECVKVEVKPGEPPCTGDEHDWQAPYEILGGLKENPGVWGSGGGVKYTLVCMTCGCGKHVNTWAQDSNDGEQGLTSVSYEKGEFRERLEELQDE